MSKLPALGIDLGTTNSVVAIVDGGKAQVLTDRDGHRMVPSVVSFHPEGHVLVGYAGRERRLLDAPNTVYAVKRLIGRPFDSPEVARARDRFAFEIVENKHGGSVVQVRKGKYALAEISAMVLRELRRIAEGNLGAVPEQAVITVPANFNELQRSATKAAGKVAGLDVLRILNEPTAAALAFGYGGGERERIAVYDLGGGTFDITILELEDDVFEVLSTAGDTFLGGEDLDGLLAEVMAEEFRKQHKWDPRKDLQAFERLKAAAEWAKCELSTETEVELTVEELTRRRRKSLDLNFQMTRQELEAVASPWLERSFEVCSDALRAAKLRVSDLDRVILVGGSTRMPLCRRRVAEYFGKEPRTDIDPDLVVAQGAAIQAAALSNTYDRKRTLIGQGQRTLARAGRSQTKAGVTAASDRRQPAFSPAEHTVRAVSTDTLGFNSERAPAVIGQPNSQPNSEPHNTRAPHDTREPEGSASGVPLDFEALPELELDDLLALESERPADLGQELFGDLPIPDGPSSPLESLSDPFNTNAGLEGLPTPAGSDPIQKRPVPAPQRRSVPSPRSNRPSAKPAGITRSTAQAQQLRPSQSPAAPMVDLSDAPPPLLMDVTPHSLGIETAGGYCRRLIRKNAPLPTEQSRRFTTAIDNQEEVAIRISQGESDAFSDNDALGEVILSGLPARPRGETEIEVLFVLDSNGSLSVSAKDVESGLAQATKVVLRGGHSDLDIEAMLRRQVEELGEQ